jgi:hypothetical protein
MQTRFSDLDPRVHSDQFSSLPQDKEFHLFTHSDITVKPRFRGIPFTQSCARTRISFMKQTDVTGSTILDYPIWLLFETRSLSVIATLFHLNERFYLTFSLKIIETISATFFSCLAGTCRIVQVLHYSLWFSSSCSTYAPWIRVTYQAFKRHQI